MRAGVTSTIMTATSQPSASFGDVSTRLSTALAAVGFAATVSQIILFRELLVVCEGNEISIGVAFSSWLIWTSVGSSLLGRLLPTTNPSVKFMVLMGSLPLALGLSVLLMHHSRTFWNAAPGEILGPLAMLTIVTTAFAPICCISGWLFAVGVGVLRNDESHGEMRSGGMMYLLESLGAAIGGLVASIAFVCSMNTYQIIFIVTAVAWLAAVEILRPLRIYVILSIVCVTTVLCTIPLSRQIEWHDAQLLWPRASVIGIEHSRYGSLAIYESEGSRFVVQNGITLFTVPDPASAEESAHFPLLEHEAPRRVLLIGGGLGGSIEEILRHPTVMQVNYVELDPALIRMARHSFESEWRLILSHPNVKIIESDGRLYLKNTDERFDVIILNVPDPTTAQLNRYFTEEFYREAQHHLNGSGVLGFQVRGAEEYISPEMSHYLRCVRGTLSKVFPKVVVIPGESVHFVASSDAELTTDPLILLGRLRERHVETKYIREYFLPYRLEPSRVHELEIATRPTTKTLTNNDFKPAAYYFNLALWEMQFSSKSQRFFQLAAAVSLKTLLWMLLIIAVGIGVALCLKRKRRALAATSVACAGLVTMSSEILLLLGFQAVYGYIFHELAMIIAGFMAGLALGSRIALRWNVAVALGRLKALQLALAILPAAVVYGLRALSGAGNGWTAILPALFFLVAALCGCLGGLQFTAALALLTGVQEHDTGMLYASDLVGACVAAISVSLYLLPIYGFAATGWVIASVNLAPLIALVIFAKH